MIRQFDKLLDGAAHTLFEIAGQQPDVAPQVGPVAALLSLIAADVDTHVATRLQEAAQIKSLLRRSRDLMPAADVRDVDRALASDLVQPSDYTLGNLESYVAGLREALIQVHAWLESPEGRSHPDLLDELWSFLQSDADHAGRLAPSLW